ncbi:MAG: phosphotransferase [Pseudomonadota bacterium]
MSAVDDGDNRFLNGRDLTPYRRAILAARPDLEGAPLSLNPDGWDCVAVEGAGHVFKFPRHEAAAERLIQEPKTLALIAPHATLTVPAMRLHHTPVLFSEHKMIAGRSVDSAFYATLQTPVRERLAADVARFTAALNAIPVDKALAAGCTHQRPRPTLEVLGQRVWPLLDDDVKGDASAILTAASAYGPDTPVFGHFDTHGWNMAFDENARVLNGLFDFADSGVGPLHRDLSYTAFISPDLVARVARAYVVITGRRLDMDRIFNEHGVLRLIELADATDDPRPFVDALRTWCDDLSRWRGAQPHGDKA